jgi:hypothetical protein
VQADGVWFTNNNSIIRIGLPALTQDLIIPLGTDTPTSLLPMPGGGFLLHTYATNGVRFLRRFAADGTMTYRTPTGIDNDLESVSADGQFAANRYELVDATTGVAICRTLLNPQPRVGMALVTASNSTNFLAVANFYSDDVQIQENDRQSALWQSPSSFGRVITPPVVIFDPVTNGGETLSTVTFASSAYSNVRVFASSSTTGVVTFASSAYNVAIPVGSNIQTEVSYNPQDPGPHLGFLRADGDWYIGGHTAGGYETALLFGRTTPAVSLTTGQISNLVRYARSQLKYFLDAESNNLRVGWPCSWYSPESGRALGSYCVPHEIGLRLLTLAAAARQGWLDTNTAWTQVELGLDNLRLMQQRSDQFPNGTFYRYYVIRNPDGTDRNVAEITHDPDAPSSDDNCLLAMSLMLVDRLARDAQRGSASSLCRQVLAQMNMRWFYNAAVNRIPHYRTPTGSYSSVYWDRRGAEGPAIAAAMACLGQLSRDEFSSVISGMASPWGHWRGRIFVPQGDTLGAMFIRGVRAQAGCPITPDESANCNYAAGTTALLAAHLDDCDDRGAGMIFSHGMTVTVDGVRQTRKGPGNETGAVLPEERQARTGTHAAFVPLARARWIPQDMIARLFGQMADYEPLYFHDEPGRRGWEAVVPLDVHGPYLGADQGHVHEALNSAYIVLSVFDALAPQPLSALHPAQTLLGHAMAFVDGDTLPPADFPGAYQPDLHIPTGSLGVTVRPATVTTAGARWRVDNGLWTNSGATLSSLVAGNHTVAFNTVWGWITPSNLTVTITDSETNVITGTYTKDGITNPADGSTFSSASIAFNWNAIAGATQYAMWAGTTPGGSELYAMIEGGNRSRTLIMPTDGNSVHVRLWALIGGTWQAVNDYSYTAAPTPVKAVMISPTSGSTNGGASVTFNWSAGTGASQYALWIGSASNGYDLYANVEGTNLARTLTLPVDGRPIYVKLWSCLYGNWQGNDYAYTAYSAPAAKAVMLSPVNGSTNSSASMAFQWDAGARVSQYALWVGSASNSPDLFAAVVGTNLTRTVTGLPVDGRSLFVRLWSFINGEWLSNDYGYRAFNAVKGRLTNFVNGATFGSGSVTLNWNGGAGASQYALWVGNALGAYDLGAFGPGTNLSQALSGLPTDGRPLYVRLWSLINGAWKQNNYLFTAYTAPSSRAAMLSPTNGTVLVTNPVTLLWSAGTGVSQYAFWIGSTPGSAGLQAQMAGTNRTWNVTLPLDGNPVYVRLWSQISGTWQSNDYAYETSFGTAAKAAMTSHANGAVLEGAATVFGWSAGAGVSQYALWIGNTPGSYDLYAAGCGTNRTQTVTGLPVDGGPVYVRLWSLMGGTWKSNDYFYSAYLEP